MTSSSKPTPIIPILIGALIVYNLLYWVGKFYPEFSSFTASFFSAVREHWGLLSFLEFLGVASIFVDLVIRFDQFTGNARTGRLVLTGVIFAAFIARLIFGIIDMYKVGEVR